MWVEIDTVYETSAVIKAVKHAYQLDNYLIRASNDDFLFPFFPKITLIINKSTTGIAGRIEQLGYIMTTMTTTRYITNLETIVFVHTSNLWCRKKDALILIFFLEAFITKAKTNFLWQSQVVWHPIKLQL